jgi:hypothetical protein
MAEGLHIEPADDRRPPLKVNIYESARGATSTLAPLFPYLHPGAIVPTVALFWGRQDGDYGFFQHANTVDEVVIIFGADGATGRARTGLVRANARTHGVGKFLPNPDDETAFSLIAITQRQEDERPQDEAVWFKCEQCQADLGRLDFKWDPNDPSTRAQSEDPLAPLFTLVMSARAASGFNDSHGGRPCPSCGHVNEPFPLDRWGWDRYVAQSIAAQKARVALVEAATGD